MDLLHSETMKLTPLNNKLLLASGVFLNFHPYFSVNIAGFKDIWVIDQFLVFLYLKHSSMSSRCPISVSVARAFQVARVLV